MLRGGGKAFQANGSPCSEAQRCSVFGELLVI